MLRQPCLGALPAEGASAVQEVGTTHASTVGSALLISQCCCALRMRLQLREGSQTFRGTFPKNNTTITTLHQNHCLTKILHDLQASRSCHC